MKKEKIIDDIKNILNSEVTIGQDQYSSIIENYDFQINCFALNFKNIMDNIDLFLEGKYKIDPQVNRVVINECFLLNYPFYDSEVNISFEYENNKIGIPKNSKSKFCFSIEQVSNRDDSFSFDFKYHDEYNLLIKTPNYSPNKLIHGLPFQATIREYSMKKLQSYHNNHTHNFHKRTEELKIMTHLFDVVNGSKLHVRDFFDSKKHYTLNNIFSVFQSKNFKEKAELLQLTEDSDLLLNINKKIEEMKNKSIQHTFELTSL